MPPPQPIPGTRAVKRVLSLLSAFTERRPRWNLTDLSAEVGLSKATAHRMLAVLEQEGVIMRRPGTADFQLGPEMIVLGALALKAVDFRGAARPELEFLSKATGEAASLESLVGAEVLITPCHAPDCTSPADGVAGYTQRYPVKIGASFASQSLLDVVAGLGPTTRAHVEVRWPDGQRDDLGTFPAGARVLLIERQAPVVVAGADR